MTIKDATKTDTWCVYNSCERDPITNQCFDADDCPECWDGRPEEATLNYNPAVEGVRAFGQSLMEPETYLFDIVRDAIGEWPQFHLIRHHSEDMEHCPCCDVHVPDINCVANVNDLVEDPEHCWHLPDDVAVVEENGFGGLMVIICNDCVTGAKGHFAQP
jgi:hypothetical protein